MDEAEQLMMPFFPHDVYLAGKALSNSMAEQEGILLPDWIWDAVVQQYFTYMVMQRMALKAEHMRERLSTDDPYKLKTVELTMMERPSLN
tara:strand:- start:270 stop:539 length:270 start_codon:yes stop_codon:yes gene_type:complete